MTAPFDTALRSMAMGPGKDAVIQVLDTAYLVDSWLLQYGVKRDADTLLAFVKLILEREDSFYERGE